ncbi:MAG: hypothetical protein DMG08_27720 [Acidobacteria bacterium]|nr:MAG: hypothetical protein DMG08_27720 [Acidobacteriota bacterium]
MLGLHVFALTRQEKAQIGVSRHQLRLIFNHLPEQLPCLVFLPLPGIEDAEINLCLDGLRINTQSSLELPFGLRDFAFVHIQGTKLIAGDRHIWVQLSGLL